MGVKTYCEGCKNLTEKKNEKIVEYHDNFNVWENECSKCGYKNTEEEAKGDGPYYYEA